MHEARLKTAGLKVTSARQKLLALFEAHTDQHLSADAIYGLLKKQDASVSLATVYRVLTQFVEAGLVIAHQFSQDCMVYELNEGEHHDHMQCVHCHKILEFVDETIEERQLVIAKEAQFEITDHVLVIYGLCRACQLQKNPVSD